MQTLLQIANKEDLINELETTILEYCEEVVGLELSELFQEDLLQITEQILQEHGRDGKDMSSIEGTYFFHTIFSTMVPDLYAMWYELERETFDDENFFVANKDTKKALKEATTVYNEWGLELTESLLVQELKRALQHRLHTLREELAIKLLHERDILHIQPAKGNVVSEELLNIFKELTQVEKKFDSLMNKIESVSFIKVD